MAITKRGVKYLIEFREINDRASIAEPNVPKECIHVTIHDLGAGPFLSIKTENLSPDEEFDVGMVALDSREDIQQLADCLIEILDENKEV